MAKRKRSATSSKPVSFRFKPEVLQLLNELVGIKVKCADCGKEIKRYTSKINVIEDSLAGLVHFLLRKRIAKQQLNDNRGSPSQLFRLYIMVCRADRDEKGYGFKKLGKERFVYGPEPAEKSAYAHMIEKHEK